MKKLLFFVLVLLLCSCHQEEPKPIVPNNIIPNAVRDVDGNSYDAVVIGQQTWMLQNLRTTRFADRTPITHTNSYDGPQVSQPLYYEPLITYYYTSDSYPPNTSVSTGLIYNWAVATYCPTSPDSTPSHIQGACPDGWHIPDKVEWQQLIDYVNSRFTLCECGDGIGHNAKALSSVVTWESSGSCQTCSPNYHQSSNNASGFNAIAVLYEIPPDNYHYWFYRRANYWSCTKEKSNSQWVDSVPCTFRIEYCTPFAYLNNDELPYLASIRCIKD